MLKGEDFVANTRLTDRAGNVRAAVGESCAKVDPASLEWLLEDGLISRKPVVTVDKEARR